VRSGRFDRLTGKNGLFFTVS